MSERRVYVIELSDDIGPRRDPQFPNVYVGETGRTPEERFETHMAGGRTASKKVARHGLRLLTDLYGHLPSYETEGESVAAEKRLCKQLRKMGYTVWGGTMGMSESFAKRSAEAS